MFNIKHPTQTFSYFIYFRPQEIFNWLLLVDDRDYDVWDQPRISWHIKYQRPTPPPDGVGHHGLHHQADEAMPKSEDFATTALEGHFHPDSYRLRAKMSIKKDEVQAVIPIAKHKDLMNLAILTGRQVSRPLKVFIVSQAGDVADVTLHSSCSSVDQSVLKVYCLKFLFDKLYEIFLEGKNVKTSRMFSIM